ncbi:hypothetical protein GCM10011376_37620 [Nocardioides flavus (ex Wang et al. 2016)]|uniref:DUF488 domain-containing protein n=1 Tax=Nocardioides flavus (ex Wang et al. 2016) TaxID=2058780 RepID=A0ABQ3HNB7_9ACTN|nr:DUF488 domain-containing protein [Nocardioides flavus (ex Wang et al. 2016)]GHE19152.1 hypothetical protein GCM10011376_37620 [Nocardioides flavus (ex Wang et al. 2016)]
MNEDGTIYTVGHSTHEIETFLELLAKHEISAVADVRSTPASRFNPQFNREALKAALGRVSIGYVYLGRELGARSDDPSCYVDGKVQYERLAKTPAYGAGIERLITGRADHRIAIMCSEREPLDCHRTVLVTESLFALGVPVVHILGDGALEPHDETRARLREIHGLAEPDLFHSTEELVAQALSRQEERIAYVDSDRQEAVGD